MRTLGLALLAACGGPPGPQPAQVDTDLTVGDDDDDDDTSASPVAQTIRVVTWNVEGVGAADTDETAALTAILARLDADVVALNEIDEFETPTLEGIAAELGYDHVVVPASNPFGELRNAVLSRLPVVESVVWTSDVLSGDDAANDLTRLPISVTVEVAGSTLTVVSQHWKSGWYDADEFRRAGDNLRTLQAAARSDSEYLFVLGDMNHEIDELESPPTFTEIPYGMPSGFWVGADLYDQLVNGGIVADPFPAIAAAGLTPLDALQADGRIGTRDESGKRIDFIHANAAALDALLGTVVYDSRDDDDIVTIPLTGEAPAREASLMASDHFPVVADISIGD